MIDEREFFIRKAIGWVLREVSKERPALTYAFLLAQMGEAGFAPPPPPPPAAEPKPVDPTPAPRS